MAENEAQARQLVVNLDAAEWLELFPYDWMTEEDKTQRATVVVQRGLFALRIEREAVPGQENYVAEKLTIERDEECKIRFVVTTCVNDVIAQNAVLKGDFVRSEGKWISIMEGDPEGSFRAVACYPVQNVCGVSMHQNEAHDGAPE